MVAKLPAPGMSLGRINMKRVEVRQPAIPRRRALVAFNNPHVLKALASNLDPKRFEVVALADGDAVWAEYQRGGAQLMLLGAELPKVSGTVLCELVRKQPKGELVAMVLVSAVFQDPYKGVGACKAFGADAFFPLPASGELVHARIEGALAKREPVASLKALPDQLATRLDEVFGRFDALNYYQLLEVEEDADLRTIRGAYHQRSLQFHPDRHTRLKTNHPHAFEKVSSVYMRMTEAYRVLVDETQRRSYNLGLRKRGALRLSIDPDDDREQRELALCETDEARTHVMESLECRSFGDLEAAAIAMSEAVKTEPENEGLRQIEGALNKLVEIIMRAS